MSDNCTVQNRKISFSPPDISESEISEVCEALRSGWITTGPRTKKLEERLANFCNVNKLVCLNSATAAEELNLRILGIGPGDEVIVPAYTYTATAAAVIHCGAKVIFIDSQKDGDEITHSPEMDYDLMEAAITSNTKAIIPVDIAGIMCNYDRIYQAVENKKHLFQASNIIQEIIGRVAVVADCAHSLGASRQGKMAGEVADFSSFSFHAVKNFTTGEGGAAVWNQSILNVNSGIDDKRIYQQYQLLSLHGQSKDALSKTKIGSWEYDVIGPWYKCNMTDIAASIGLKQLSRYPDLLQRRKEIVEQYDKGLNRKSIFHLNHYGDELEGRYDYQSSGHLYLTRVIGIDEIKRNSLIKEMAENGISTNVHYKPLPMMTAYKALGWNINNFPNAYDYYRNLITLPLHTLLSNADIEYVINVFNDLTKGSLDRRKYIA